MHRAITQGLIHSSVAGSATPQGGLNLAKTSTFPNSTDAGGAGSLFEDLSGECHLLYDTDDGYGARGQKGPLTLASGDTLTWNAASTVAQTNYNLSRIVLYETFNWRMDFGLVYDSGNKLGITRYNSAGAFQNHVYLNATYVANEWFRVYIPSAGGNMVFQTSSDNITYTTLATYAWTLKDVGFRASYSVTTNTGKVNETSLFDMFKGIGDSPT